MPLLSVRMAGVTTAAFALLAGLLLPRMLGYYELQVVDLTLIEAIVALGLNYILGFGGQISLAQAPFYGIGAYAFAIAQSHGLSMPMAALAAIGVTVAIALLLGGPILRLRGHYLALATLAFSVIVEQLLINFGALTGGANGLAGIRGIGLAGNNLMMLRILLAVTSVAFLAAMAFAASPIGLKTRAFRDDPIAAQAIGINIDRVKLLLFCLSAAYAGVAGIAYDCLRGYVSPDLFAWQTTFSYLAMVVVGGLGSSLGAVLGAALYTLVPEWLRFLEGAYFIVFGLLVMLTITFFPSGLAGLLARLIRGLAPAARAPEGHADASDGHHGQVFRRGDMTATLEISGLTKRFGGLTALSDVSLVVPRGTIHAVIGPNGSGKTTLFNIISGVYAPTAGTVRLSGTTVTGRGPSWLACHGLARTFQNTRLFGSMTVRENVLAGLYGRSSALRFMQASDARCDEILDFCGLIAIADQSAAALPQGQRRLLELAKAVATDPAIILLDEPHGGLNHTETVRLIALIRRLAETGLTILLIEHEMDVVMKLAHRITVLNFGAVLAEGTPAEIQADEKVIEAYLGKPDSAAPSRIPMSASRQGRKPLLDARQLVVHHGDVEAVRGVSVEVMPGEIVALLGNNGAGKTSTLNALARMNPLVGGEIHFAGRRIDREPTERLVGLGLALVPERRRLFPGMTVLDNLRMGARREKRSVVDERIDEMFSMFPNLLKHVANAAFAMSGGEQQMLAIARALMSRPKLLLLDEPSLGLSPLMTEQVFSSLLAINRTGTAILLVEQNARLALGIAHRAYVLASGVVAASGDAVALEADPQLRRAYLGASERPDPPFPRSPRDDADARRTDHVQH